MALLCAPAPTCGGIGTSAVLGEIEVREHRSTHVQRISRSRASRIVSERVYTHINKIVRVQIHVACRAF